jgi:hypothetical protein
MPPKTAAITIAVKTIANAMEIALVMGENLRVEPSQNGAPAV